MYRVEIKATASAPWKANGVIETDLTAAHASWQAVCLELGRYAYRLVPL